MNVRITVDATLCAGLGICESEAPEYFTVGEDNLSTPRRSTVAADDIDDVTSAVESCPMQALRLTRDDSTNQANS